MKPASHHEATTPGTPAEAQGIVTPQRAYASAAGLAKRFELTPLVATPRGGVTHTVQKSCPHPVGRPYTIHIHGARASSQPPGFFPMQNNQKFMSENQQLLLNLQVHGTFQNPPPVTAAVTEFNGDGDQVPPSKLPLILQSPLALLPEEQALAYLAASDNETPPGIDANKLRDFTDGLVRRRVMTLEWAYSKSYVEVIWSPKLGTGVVLDSDPVEEIHFGKEINAFTSADMSRAMGEMWFEKVLPDLRESVLPVTVDRNLLSEEQLAVAFAGSYASYLPPEEATLAGQSAVWHCAKWVDKID